VIDGLFYSTSAGTVHLRKLLDALATLPDDRGPPLADVLAATACRNFDDGLQVVIATDRSLAELGSRANAPNRRFFLLEAHGFGSSTEAETPSLSIRPWVRVSAPDRVRHALRSGWKEAIHGG
jgi:hypothetical protein